MSIYSSVSSGVAERSKYGIHTKVVEDSLCFPEHSIIWGGPKKGRKRWAAFVSTAKFTKSFLFWVWRALSCLRAHEPTAQKQACCLASTLPLDFSLHHTSSKKPSLPSCLFCGLAWPLFFFFFFYYYCGIYWRCNCLVTFRPWVWWGRGKCLPHSHPCFQYSLTDALTYLWCT